MRKILKIAVLSLALLCGHCDIPGECNMLGTHPARATVPTSTINIALPLQGAPLSSQVMRDQFTAAYNDINALYIESSVLQPLSPVLVGLANENPTAADTLLYSNGSNTFAATTYTPLARTLDGDTTAAAMRSTLGLGALSVLDTVDNSLWSGTQLGVTNGGTGLATLAQGDLLYGSASDTISALAKDTNATRYLSNTGSSNAPAWAQVGLTNGVTGILPVANGGTGNSYFAVSGPASSAKTYTFPNASANILTDNAAVTIAQGGTGQTTANTALNAFLPDQTSNSGKVLTTDGTNSSWSTAGSGTVTSVSGSGGTTGLTLTGGAITGAGTLTLGGTLAIANGGTGTTTANGALNAFLPSQGGNSGKVLSTDGAGTTSWISVAGTGTVTSIDASGGTTGLTFSGGPVTASGTLTVAGNLLASSLQSTPSDLGNADVTVDLTNSHSGKVTNLTTDGTVTATTFVGALTGNASTATALATARAIGGVNFDGTAAITPTQIQPASEAADATNFLAFFNAASGTAQQPKYNSGLTYDSTSNTVGATTFSGALSGNSSTATALATPRAIYGNNFDGTAALTQIIASTYGGTGNGFAKFSGPTSTEKTFTLPDSNATLLYSGGALGTPSSGTATNLTGTASGLTAGSATALATARAIYGNNFDGTAALTQIIASTYGGTGNGFAKLSGPASTEKTFTLPNASATILTDNAAVTVAQGGTGAATLTAHGLVIGEGTSAVHITGTGTSGQVLTSNGSLADPTFQDAASGSGITLGTKQNTTSGTTVSFTSIPAGVKRIKVMFKGVSTNGSDDLLVQIGSGSYTTSGYVGNSGSVSNTNNASQTNYTTGIGIPSFSSSDIITGTITFDLMDSASNLWVASGTVADTGNGRARFTSGYIALSGAVDRVRLNTVAGTDTFDAGAMNISYE